MDRLVGIGVYEDELAAFVIVLVLEVLLAGLLLLRSRVVFDLIGGSICRELHYVSMCA